ncbi:MAG TPA: zinc ribbon domain-containing protein [Anaerolineales bacterium]|nr:zinc ribbon domain-containing protein [Anaerolineales bacterium]
MKNINWLVVAVISVIVLLFLFGAGMMMGGWGYRGYGMMGPGMMGGWGYSPFGWIGMAFMWLIPIGVITLIVFGVAALVRNAGNSKSPSSQTPCPNCGKGAQSEWKNCPYCGTALQ